MWSVGVVALMPLIVLGSLAAVLVFAASEVAHSAKQAATRRGAEPLDPAPLAPVVELPSVTESPITQAA